MAPPAVLVGDGIWGIPPYAGEYVPGIADGAETGVATEGGGLTTGEALGSVGNHH